MWLVPHFTLRTSAVAIKGKSVFKAHIVTSEGQEVHIIILMVGSEPCSGNAGKTEVFQRWIMV